ncbi:MAG: carboxypeptidase-like regulatory domain-containing protein, partial [Opitutaceae bacterium]
LGDNLYSLSPLTERWLFGRGIGVKYQQPSSAIGGYYAYTPWQSADVRQLGFFAQFAPWPAVSLRSNFLLEETPATEPWMDPRSFLPSLQLFLQPGKSATLELEGALSDNSELSTGGAYRARLKGDLGKTVFYDFERIYASPDYFGYYSDFASTSGTVSWRIDRDWTLRTSFEDAESNLELDPRKGPALQVVDESVGIDRSITREFSVSLEPHYTSYTDHLPDGQPTFIQDTLALSGTWTTSVYTVRASVEDGGRQLDTSPRQNLGYKSVSLLGIAQPNPNLTFSLLVSDGDSPYTAERLREVVVNGAAQVNFGNGWRVRAIASATQSHDPPRLTQQAMADVLLGYDFRNGISVQVGVRDSATTGAGPDRGAYLSWSIPLPIQPLRKRAYGSVAGIVQLREGETLKPLGGVILHLEKLLAITDHDGHFLFPLIKPGRHELTVDPASLGPGIVLNAPGPGAVEVTRGQRALRQLEGVRASRIEGEVALFDVAPEGYEDLANGTLPGLRRSGAVGNVLVEARLGSTIRRTESDEKGYFAFDRLLPGEWTVTIDD